MSQICTSAIRSDWAVHPRSDRTVVEAAGPDTRGLLHRVLSADINGLENGQGCPAALLTPKARVVASLDVIQLATDRLWLVVDSRRADALIEALDRYIIVDDVELSKPALVGVGVWGPGLKGWSAAAEISNLPAYNHRSATIAGVQAHAVADDSLGVQGATLWVTDASELIEKATAAGAQQVDASVVEAARIEAGVPEQGAEMSEDTILLEAGQLSRVSFSKGCYIGQEPVCRIHSRGQVARMVVGLRLPSWAAPGTALSHADKADAGAVTSVSDSAAAGGVIALARVHRKVAANGTKLQLPDGSEAEVVALPHVALDKTPLTLPRYGD